MAGWIFGRELPSAATRLGDAIEIDEQGDDQRPPRFGQNSARPELGIGIERELQRARLVGDREWLELAQEAFSV